MTKNRYRVAVTAVIEVDAASRSEARIWATLALGLRNSVYSGRYHDDLCKTVPYKSNVTGQDVVANAVAVYADVAAVFEPDAAHVIPYGSADEQWTD